MNPTYGTHCAAVKMNLSEIIVDVHLVLVSDNLVEISLSFFFLKFPQSENEN